MIRVFMEQAAMTICMFSCMVLGIFLKLFLGILYAHMIKEADNMASTDNKLLKQCKTKFSNCYELNNGISNVSVFVDKFLNRLSLGPFSFEMLYHLSGQLMLLSVVFMSAAAQSGKRAEILQKEDNYVPARDAAVTEEELETLLKEFLTG